MLYENSVKILLSHYNNICQRLLPEFNFINVFKIIFNFRIQDYISKPLQEYSFGNSDFERHLQRV